MASAPCCCGHTWAKHAENGKCAAAFCFCGGFHHPPVNKPRGESLNRDNRMTPNREKHLSRVKRLITARIDAKYRRGQREHGGDMWMKSIDALLEDALDEISDLVVYLLTLREAIQWERPTK